jgi:3-deoxy-7-phosphoheptulonate synthase
VVILLAPDADVVRVRAALQGLGLWTEPVSGAAGAVAGLEVLPHSRAVPREAIRQVSGVADVVERKSPHPLVDAQAGRAATVGRVQVGGGAPVVLMAGPCSAESEPQVTASARLVASVGGKLLRGGAYKPRTSPYGFQGHGREALAWLRRAADAHGLGLVTEVVDEAEVEAVAAVADLVQVGSRNMQNFGLLRAVGKTGRPVLLKRGMGARVSEWLLAGEHLLHAGAAAVIYCERGVVGFDPATRNLLDLGAVALLKHVHRLPVVVDVSHAAGRRDLIPPLARAAVAAGADGLLLEAHPDPSQALTDGPQALDPETLAALARDVVGGGP